MSKSDLKRDQILEAGMDVMKCQGYNGTSVKDIVDAAGVPKGSFYNYFDSKEAFAVTALERASAADLAAGTAVLSNRQVPPLERLVEFFQSQIGRCCDNQFSTGCFLGNMCQEMADSSELIRAKLRRLLEEHTRLIQSVLDEAVARGELAESTDTATLAEFLFNAWEGAMMRMKASKSREPLDAFVHQLSRLLAAPPHQGVQRKAD